MAKYLELNGKRYEWSNALRRPTLNDLMALKLATGIGMRQITAQLRTYDRLALDAQARRATWEEFAEDLSEEPDVMAALRALVWLARRQAGEHLTIDEAGDFRPDEFRIVADEPAEAPADPTPPATVSAPDAGNPAAAANPSSSTTSETTSSST